VTVEGDVSRRLLVTRDSSPVVLWTFSMFVIIREYSPIRQLYQIKKEQYFHKVPLPNQLGAIDLLIELRRAIYISNGYRQCCGAGHLGCVYTCACFFLDRLMEF